METQQKIKILILKRDKLGDMLLTTPMLQLLRKHYPYAEIHILTSNYAAWVAESFPFVDKVWSYQKVRLKNSISITAITKQIYIFFRLRRIKFDWGIAAGGEYSHRAVRRLLWAGADKNISYSTNNSFKISHPFIEPKTGHEALRISKLLLPLNIRIPREPSFLPDVYYKPTQDIFKSSHKYLREHNLIKNKYIIIGLGARRKKKQLSPDQVHSIANYFLNHHNLNTVLMWTPGKSEDPNYPNDEKTANKILSINNNIIPFCGPIKQSVGIIWDAKFSIFPDSGLMHFAACSPGGGLGLFAEVDISPHPNQWGPLGSNSSYLTAEISISKTSTDKILNHIKKTIT